MQHQSWFSRYWMWLAGGGCVLLICCGFGSLFFAGLLATQLPEEPSAPPTVAGTTSARVECGTPGPDGVDCEVTRTGGAGGLSACWDLEITCANGGTMVGAGCGSLVAGSARATVNLPVSSFSNQEACDAPKQGRVQNLVVTDE